MKKKYLCLILSLTAFSSLFAVNINNIVRNSAISINNVRAADGEETTSSESSTTNSNKITADDLGKEETMDVWDNDGIDSGSSYIIDTVTLNKLDPNHGIDYNAYPYQDRGLYVSGSSTSDTTCNGNGLYGTTLKQANGSSLLGDDFHWTVVKHEEGYTFKSVSAGTYLNIADEPSDNVVTVSSTIQYFDVFFNDDGTCTISRISSTTGKRVYLFRDLHPYSKVGYRTSYSSTSFKLFKRVTIKTTNSPKGTSNVAFDQTNVGSYFDNPTLISLDNGAMVATADARFNSVAAFGNSDNVVSLSNDKGSNWSWDTVNCFNDYVNDKSDVNSATFTNSSLTAVGNSVYLISNVVPAGVDESNMGSGTAGFNEWGSFYLRIDQSSNPENTAISTNASDYNYFFNINNKRTETILGQSYTVYPIKNPSDMETDYFVDTLFNLYYKDGGVLSPLAIKQTSDSDKYVQANIFHRASMFKAYPTTYTIARRAEYLDGALNWNDMKIINIKSSEEKDLYNGVGKGINIKDKVYFPVYSPSLNRASIISLDLSTNNYSRLASVTCNDVKEVKLIQLPNNDLRLYCENGSSSLTSFDYSVSSNSFSTAKTTEIEVDTDGATVINVNGTLSYDGTSYADVILSVSNKNENGLVKIGAVASDGTTTWLKEKALSHKVATPTITQISNISSEFSLLYKNEQNYISSETITIADICGEGWELCPVGSIVSHSISPNGNIGLNYYIKLTKYAIDKKEFVKLKLTLDGETYVANYSYVNGENYVFSINTNSTQMSSNITAQFVLNSYESNILDTYSVNNYCDDAKALNDAKLSALAEAMKRYGAYSKAYFNEEELEADDTITAVDTTALDAYKASITTSGEETAIEYKGSTLILDSNTSIRHYFKLLDESSSIKDDAHVKYSEKKNLYYYEISDIAANKLSNTYSITISNTTINYSALSYVRSAVKSSNQSLVNLAKALYLYSVAADAYYTK